MLYNQDIRYFFILSLLLLGGCKVMTYPHVSFVKGEIVSHCFWNNDIIIDQVVSPELIHAYSWDDGAPKGLRIAIQPLTGEYVTGEHVRHGKYEYLGPMTYTILKDGKGNDSQTNTVRLFRELPN